MEKKSLNIVICAIVLALTIVLSIIPVPYGGHFLLPILFCACCFGYGMSLYASASFGVISLILCMMSPVSPLAKFFVDNPWVPIVPRLFIGPVAHSVYLLMRKLMGKITQKENTATKTIPIVCAAIAGTFTNTLLVGICMLGLNLKGAEGLLILSELVMVGAIEICITAAVLPAIVLTVRKAVPMFRYQNAPLKKKETVVAVVNNAEDAAFLEADVAANFKPTEENPT